MANRSDDGDLDAVILEVGELIVAHAVVYSQID